MKTMIINKKIKLVTMIIDAEAYPYLSYSLRTSFIKFISIPFHFNQFNSTQYHLHLCNACFPQLRLCINATHLKLNVRNFYFKLFNLLRFYCFDTFLWADTVFYVESLKLGTSTLKSHFYLYVITALQFTNGKVRNKRFNKSQ